MDQLWAGFSDALMFVALIGYVVVVLAFAAARAFGRPPARKPARASVTVGAAPPEPSLAESFSAEDGAARFTSANIIMVLATAAHTAAVALRGMAIGAVPLSTMYEFVTACALVAAVCHLVLARLRREARALGLYVAAGIAVALGSAMTGLYAEAGPLIPALRSGWLAIHVTAAVAASGAFTLGAITSALFLRALRSGTVHG
jgi:ABC-type transport system involved in cytochrome c biogenesis permease subunit